MAAFTESELEDEFEGEEEEEVNNEPEPGFAIGEVVFPVEKEKDFVDPTAILINHADTYVGKNLGIVSSEFRLIRSHSRTIYVIETNDSSAFVTRDCRILLLSVPEYSKDRRRRRGIRRGGTSGRGRQCERRGAQVLETFRYSEKS